MGGDIRGCSITLKDNKVYRVLCAEEWFEPLVLCPRDTLEVCVYPRDRRPFPAQLLLREPRVG